MFRRRSKRFDPTATDPIFSSFASSSSACPFLTSSHFSPEHDEEKKKCRARTHTLTHTHTFFHFVPSSRKNSTFSPWKIVLSRGRIRAPPSAVSHCALLAGIPRVPHCSKTERISTDPTTKEIRGPLCCNFCLLLLLTLRTKASAASLAPAVLLLFVCRHDCSTFNLLKSTRFFDSNDVFVCIIPLNSFQ